MNGWSLPDVPPDPSWREGADHLLAYVGTISEQDNVDHLVDALAVLRARGRVQGGRRGRRARPSKRSSSGRASAESRDSFDWLGLVTERARIASLVRAADVCVAPEIDSEFNRLATFVKIIEYMSAGAPVVAHRLPQTEALAGDTIQLRSRHDGRRDSPPPSAISLDAPERRRATGRRRPAGDSTSGSAGSAPAGHGWSRATTGCSGAARAGVSRAAKALRVAVLVESLTVPEWVEMDGGADRRRGRVRAHGGAAGEPGARALRGSGRARARAT